MESNLRRLAIVCNPVAGNGKAVDLAREIAKALDRKKITYQVFVDQWPGDFNGFTDLFIVGGDGTLNYFINKYPSTGLPMVIFRGGTGNDFHWMLYGELGVEEQLNLVLTAQPAPVDAGKCNGRFFMNGVGVGFDGAVVRSLVGKKKRPGKASFMAAILKKIFFYKSRNYVIGSKDYNKTGRKLLIGIANGRRAGGGFHIAPVAAVNDGLLDIVIVGAINPLKRLRYLPVIEKGNHLDLSFIECFKSEKISIRSESPMDVHIDGEYVESKVLDIEILPAQFQFCY